MIIGQRLNQKSCKMHSRRQCYIRDVDGTTAEPATHSSLTDRAIYTFRAIFVKVSFSARKSSGVSLNSHIFRVNVSLVKSFIKIIAIYDLKDPDIFTEADVP